MQALLGGGTSATVQEQEGKGVGMGLVQGSVQRLKTSWRKSSPCKLIKELKFVDLLP